jgi:hypothetical protein
MPEEGDRKATVWRVSDFLRVRTCGAPTASLRSFQMGGGRMSKSYLVVCALLAGYYSLSVAEAADRAVPRTTQSVRQCGCCGCLHVFYDHHRELRATYGAGIDPRNYDQTEPHYYFGPVRAYPQYWSDRNDYEFHY